MITDADVCNAVWAWRSDVMMAICPREHGATMPREEHRPMWDAFIASLNALPDVKDGRSTPSDAKIAEAFVWFSHGWKRRFSRGWMRRGERGEHA